MSHVFLAETAFRYWEQLDCPRSLSLTIMARYKDWAGVLASKANPKDYVTPEDYAKANAAVCFLKKNPAVPGSSDVLRKEAAVKTWFAGEASCYHTNERLATFLVSPLQGGAPAEFLRRVRGRLLSFIGTGVSDEELQRHARHGPGTTFSSSVANPTAADKYIEVPTLTHAAVWYLASLVGTKWGDQIASRYNGSMDNVVCYTRGNRFTAVPKTALTHRAIAIEASVNVYFQLAVGTVLRKRLHQRTGWNLNTAADIHREMARRSSVNGSFATLDLSNASDTLSKNLVRILLGNTRWLPVLEDLRSPRTFINGRWHLLEKFSSMGNGYTFELETLIFAAICSECLVLKGHVPLLGHNLFVFGDDIIVPTDTAQLVIDTLAWLGFTINTDKSFTEGPFRESCGADYFDGQPVRGFYLKESINYATQTVFTLHNGAKRVFSEIGISSPWFLEWTRLRWLPERLRHIGGSHRLGDTVLHGVPARYSWKNGIRWTKAVRWHSPVTIGWHHFNESVRLACALTGYGHTFGIDSRGLRPCLRLEWVSDS